ncbi:MAG: GAF domain-containing protein [Candidatus Sericytochromatia bacterium]
MDELLSKITNTTSVVMRAEASSIALMDHSTDELVFQFVHGDASDAVRTFRVPVGTGISGWVAKYGVPLIVPDAQKDPRFSNKSDEKSHFITKSVICVPLKREESVIGILQSLNRKDGGVFTNQDLSIFESLAGIASIAIENAQLYTVLHQRLQQLEEAKQRNESILNQLKKSEEETEKLKELSHNRGSFSGKLGVFRVENLVQMLGNDYKTGKLSLKDNENEEAYIYLQNGKLKHVELKNRNLKGINAFYETICWQDGDFSFEDSINVEDNTIDKMSMSIIIEGLRRLDEYNVLKEKYASNLVPKYAFESQINLAPEANDSPKISVLKSINGTSSIHDLLWNSYLDRYSFYTAIKELEEDQMIKF